MNLPAVSNSNTQHVFRRHRWTVEQIDAGRVDLADCVIVRSNEKQFGFDCSACRALIVVVDVDGSIDLVQRLSTQTRVLLLTDRLDLAARAASEFKVAVEPLTNWPLTKLGGRHRGRPLIIGQTTSFATSSQIENLHKSADDRDAFVTSSVSFVRHLIHESFQTNSCPVSSIAVLDDIGISMDELVLLKVPLLNLSISHLRDSLNFPSMNDDQFELIGDFFSYLDHYPYYDWYVNLAHINFVTVVSEFRKNAGAFLDFFTKQLAAVL